MKLMQKQQLILYKIDFKNYGNLLIFFRKIKEKKKKIIMSKFRAK